MPGHCLAALVAYPHLSCTGEQYKIHTFLEGPGIHNEIYCAGNEQVFEFLEGVLTEVCELFPSKYIHVGGDEAPKVFWKKCPKCQQTMADNNLKNEEELQGYFIQRALKILQKNNRYLIGWDEIIDESDMPLEVAGTCWRNSNFVGKFAEKGHKVVANSTIPYYFDYGYDANSSQRVYENNPIPDNLPADKRANVLGIQANFWSHIDRSEPRVDRMLFPRLLSLAGAAWSPEEQKNWARFKVKLEEHKKRLKSMYVNYYEESELEN